jgi:hypothetical protein
MPMVKPTPLCRFRRTRRASVEAHVIPRSFIRARSVPGKPNYLLSNRGDRAPRTWTGVYDNALVCERCEAVFGKFDDYGHRFFHAERFEPIAPEGEILAWQHPTADASRLKLFVLSILWRASASNRQEVRQVDLGRFEVTVRRMIESNDPGAPDEFPVVLERFDIHPSITPLFYPYRTDMDGAPCYKIELAGCTAIMAVEGRRLPPVLIDIALAPGSPVYLVAKNYDTSKERERLLGIVRGIVAKTGRLPGK